jgi:hypothetical protein
MFSTADITETGRPRELAHRRASDIDVRLMWDPRDDRLTVEVCDRADGSAFVVEVGDRPAMEVFHHPYVYAATGEPTCASIAA